MCLKFPLFFLHSYSVSVKIVFAASIKINYNDGPRYHKLLMFDGNYVLLSFVRNNSLFLSQLSLMV